jgi:predicted nucleic acid-binding protein
MQYLDTSAFLKLLIREQHSDAMAAAVEGADLWASTLLAVEAHRGALRLGVPTDEVDGLLSEVTLVLPAASTFHTAQAVGGAELRTLDALHLASALEIGIELESLVTYDRRLARGASSLGIAVSSPGLPELWWEQ